MSGRILRQRTRINYCEPEEPNFDEYLFCEECADYVFEYCAVHGPLLVIPDDKVSPHDVDPVIPRAALTIPRVFLHLAPSIIPGAGIGVFSTLTLPRGVRFGPYRGQRTHTVDSMYCWQIYDGANKRSHVVDAADAHRSNWMRYVNCARHWSEQNLVAYQYKGQLYYRTIKIIPRFTELLVFYGSEFANALQINLAKYNSAQYYQEIVYETHYLKQVDYFEDSLTSLSKNKQCNQKETSENASELLNFNDFQIIDENSNENLKIHLNESFKLDNDFSDSISEVTNDNLLINLQENIFEWENPKIQAIHEIPKYKCENCNYATSKTSSFKRHTQRHANRQTLACQYCSFATINKARFTKHCNQHLNTYNSRSFYPTPKKCELCTFETCSKWSFKAHIAKHMGYTFQCEFCPYQTYLKKHLTKHYKKHIN